MIDLERYNVALHAMQSGVAAKMGYDRKETEPKHLRVGVNAAMVEHAALAHLLMARGFITDREYTQAIADQMEAEVRSYEEWLSEKTGAKVILA